MGCTYAFIMGLGRVYQGACLLKGIIYTPSTSNRYIEVYDGLDPTSGEKVFRLFTSTHITQSFMLPEGVRFNHGIYITAYGSTEQTTVFFEPLEL